MSIVYLILCLVFGAVSCLLFCKPAPGSSKILVTDVSEISPADSFIGNLAAPFALAVSVTVCTFINGQFMILPAGKTELYGLSGSMCFIMALSGLGFADDCLRLFYRRPFGISFIWRQVAAFLLCSAYALFCCNLYGTVLRLPLYGNVDLGMWYTPICAVYNMAVLLGAQSLLSRSSGLCVSVLLVSAGSLPLLGKLQNNAMAILAAISAGIAACLFLYLYPAKRIYMGSCSSLCLGGIAGALSVGVLPMCSSVTALPLAAIGLASLCLLLWPRAGKLKKIIMCKEEGFVKYCMCAGIVCCACSILWAMYL